jgi:hypothetical protein
MEAGIDIDPKRGFHNLFFRFLVKYSNSSFNGDALVDGGFIGQKLKKQYLLKMNMISPTAYILYSMVRTEKDKLFIGIGGGYNLTNYTSNVYTTTDVNTGETQQKNYYLRLGNWADFHARAGYIFKNRLEINIDRRIDGTFTDFAFISSKNSTTALTACIRF